MKSLLLAMALVLSMPIMAKTFNYQSYDWEGKDKFDITVSVELSGDFNSKSTVKGIKIFGEQEGKAVLLFNFKPSDLVNAKWEKGGVLYISSRVVKSVVKKKYYPVHSDTNIEKEDEYSLTMKITKDGTTHEDEFYVDNNIQEEMALNATLRSL